MKLKTVLHSNARAAAVLVANGDAEIGINLVQELMPLPGIDIVGRLPGDLQLTLIFAASVLNGTKEGRVKGVDPFPAHARRGGSDQS